MSKSIIQNGRYCYETKDSNVPLHKHHVFNGPLRDWSEQEGLWVYLAWNIHERCHKDSKMAYTYKRIGQYYYEKKHSRLDFIAHAHKNYLVKALSDEEKKKYQICDEIKELDLNEFDLDLNHPFNNA